MNVINFIANNWDSIALVGGAVWGLVHHGKKQLTLRDLEETAEKIGLQIIPRLLADPLLHDDAYVRVKINAAIWTGLERMKVKKTPALEKIVDKVTEHIKGDLAAKLTDELLSRYISVSDHTAATLKQAQAEPSP